MLDPAVVCTRTHLRSAVHPAMLVSTLHLPSDRFTQARHVNVWLCMGHARIAEKLHFTPHLPRHTLSENQRSLRRCVKWLCDYSRDRHHSMQLHVPYTASVRRAWLSFSSRHSASRSSSVRSPRPCSARVCLNSFAKYLRPCRTRVCTIVPPKSLRPLPRVP